MHIIGEVALNISFVLYFFFYVPQIIHNFRSNKIGHLSLGFHALLFISATADLYYGFGRITQWQYQVVSVVMFVCLLIQHIQLCKHVDSFRHGRLIMWMLSGLIVLMLGLLWVTLLHSTSHLFLFVTMGWVERLGYWLYVIPQLMKNIKSNSADAISPVFLIIAIVTAICDTISAWCFAWGPSSLYGAPVAIVLHVLLLWQWREQRQKQIQSSPPRKILC